ncbi:MAG: HAD-IA family hydrolase [Patescibacteria group bacterium]|nr:HAD-IA family hydrolase [Patescibacteria group bacterium]
MKSRKVLIFDFDGTIANTLTLLFKIYNDLAPNFNTKSVKKSDIEKARGASFKELMKTYDVNFAKLPFLLVKIKEKLRHEIKNVQIVNGLTSVLKKLKAHNFDLGILTSNSQANVNFFIKDKKINNLFSFIYTGKNIFGKDKVIKRLLKIKQLESDQIVYIGDEVRDIEATKKVGIPIVSVTWGFNNKQILSKYSPNQIVDSPSQLFTAIKKI